MPPKGKAAVAGQVPYNEISDEDEEDDLAMMERHNMMGGDMMEPQLVRRFFGDKITTKSPSQLDVPNDPWRLVIMQAALGEAGAPKGTRIVLKVQVDEENEVVLGHFRGEEVESLSFGGSICLPPPAPHPGAQKPVAIDSTFALCFQPTCDVPHPKAPAPI